MTSSFLSNYFLSNNYLTFSTNSGTEQAARKLKPGDGIRHSFHEWSSPINKSKIFFYKVDSSLSPTKEYSNCEDYLVKIYLWVKIFFIYLCYFAPFKCVMFSEINWRNYCRGALRITLSSSVSPKFDIYPDNFKYFV